MSSDRIIRRSALLGLVALAGCGFTPALTPGAPTLALRDSVAVTAPDTIPGFAIRSRLTDRLGRAASPRYALAVSVDRALDAAALSQEGDTLRYNLVGAAGWTLTDASGAVLGAGEVESFTSYSATGSTVATQAAATDALGRLMIILADRIVADMMLLDLSA